MKIEAYGLSDIGLERETNQDAFVSDIQSNIFIVADGIAGSQHGEVASALACKTIHADLKKNQKAPHPEDALEAAILHANQNILNQAKANHSLWGMATTVCVLWIQNETAYLTHAGDSRIYYYQSPHLWQLTEDHTVAEQHNKLGLSLETVDPSDKNKITKYLGSEELLSIEIEKKVLSPNESYLICTDGLSSQLASGEISKILNLKKTDVVCDTLVKQANARGGIDNVTTVFINIL